MKKIGYILLLLVGVFVAWNILNTTKAQHPNVEVIYPKEGNPNGWEVRESDTFGNQNNREKLFFKEIKIIGVSPWRCREGTAGWCEEYPYTTPLENLDGSKVKQTKPVIPFHLAGILARVYGGETEKLEGELTLYSSNFSDTPHEYRPAWAFANDGGREMWIDATTGAPIYIEPEVIF